MLGAVLFGQIHRILQRHVIRVFDPADGVGVGHVRSGKLRGTPAVDAVPDVSSGGDDERKYQKEPHAVSPAQAVDEIVIATELDVLNPKEQPKDLVHPLSVSGTQVDRKLRQPEAQYPREGRITPPLNPFLPGSRHTGM